MVNIPVICDECNKLFPSPFNVENQGSFIIEGVGMGQCPHCGGYGQIPYASFIEKDGMLGVLKIDEGKDVDKLFEILSKLKKNPTVTTEEIEKEIAMGTPQYTEIMKFITNIMNHYGMNPVTALSFLLTLFAAFYPVYQDYTDKTEEKLSQNNELLIEQNKYLKAIAESGEMNRIHNTINSDNKPTHKEEKLRDTKKKYKYKKREGKTNFKKKK